jgi:hypothetical protein
MAVRIEKVVAFFSSCCMFCYKDLYNTEGMPVYLSVRSSKVYVIQAVFFDGKMIQTTLRYQESLTV